MDNRNDKTEDEQSTAGPAAGGASGLNQNSSGLGSGPHNDPPESERYKVNASGEISAAPSPPVAPASLQPSASNVSDVGFVRARQLGQKMFQSRWKILGGAAAIALVVVSLRSAHVRRPFSR